MKSQPLHEAHWKNSHQLARGIGRMKDVREPQGRPGDGGGACPHFVSHRPQSRSAHREESRPAGIRQVPGRPAWPCSPLHRRKGGMTCAASPRSVRFGRGFPGLVQGGRNTAGRNAKAAVRSKSSCHSGCQPENSCPEPMAHLPGIAEVDAARRPPFLVPLVSPCSTRCCRHPLR